MSADSHRRRRQSAGIRGAVPMSTSNGARSDGEYSSMSNRRTRSRESAAHLSSSWLGRTSQRTVSILVNNRHPEVELRTLHPCILSGFITSGRLPSSSLGSGDRREVIYATEPVHHEGPSGEIREETRGGFVYQLRGRRGMPLSRRLFLFIAWSVPGSGTCQCMAQVVEADHCTFPDEPAETRGQFRRLTKQRMGSTGGVRLDRRRNESMGYVSESAQSYRHATSRSIDNGAYSDGESMISMNSNGNNGNSNSGSSKRQPPRHRERYRYVLDEDRVAFTIISSMEYTQERAELRVDIIDEAFDGYADSKAMAKRTSPIWLEALGDDGDQEESGDESTMNDLYTSHGDRTPDTTDVYNYNSNSSTSNIANHGFDESSFDSNINRDVSDSRTSSIASRMFRHVTVTIRNRHYGLVLAGPHMDMRRGRNQSTPDSSIMAGNKDMTCVFRSGVLGASGIKGCLIYQIIPRAATESMSIVQRQFLAIVWDVHSSLSTDSKSRKDTGRATGRRLRAFVFTIDRPRFPHDRMERERFFRVVYEELAKATDGYRGARWCGRVGEESYTCRVKPLLSEGNDGRLMATGIVAEFRPIRSNRLPGRWPIFVPPELFVFQSSTAALKVREVIGQHNATVENEKRAPNSMVVVLLENRHSLIGLSLRSHDPGIYIGERMQGLAKQLLRDEYEVATLLLDRVYLRQKNALLGKQRTVFGYTVYELVDSSRIAANFHANTHQNRHHSLAVTSQSVDRSLVYNSNHQHHHSMIAKESRYLLVGWVKLSGRNIRFAVLVFRSVCNPDQIPNGLPESPHLRQYIYRTLISYTHCSTGIWEQDTDSGRPYHNPSASSSAASVQMNQRDGWLQGLSYSSYLGIGQIPVLSVQLYEMDGIPKSPALATYPKCDQASVAWPPSELQVQVDNSHGALRLLNGRFFSAGSRCVTEVSRHLHPNERSLGVYVPDSSSQRSIGILCFQVVDIGSNLLQHSPHVVISWCISGEAGQESLKFHADILQDKDMGYDGNLGALHAPNIYTQVMASYLKSNNPDDASITSNTDITGEWVMECTALLDIRIPYRMTTRAWMSETGQLCYNVTLSGKGSRSARRSSANSNNSIYMSNTRTRKGSMPSLSQSQVATAQWRNSTMSTSTAVTTMTMNTDVSHSTMPVNRAPFDRASMSQHSIYTLRGASSTDPSLVMPKMPVMSQLSIHHLPPPPPPPPLPPPPPSIPTNLLIKLRIQNQLELIQLCTPRTFLMDSNITPTTLDTFPIEAILPKQSTEFVLDLPLTPDTCTTSTIIKGCTMYEVRGATNTAEEGGAISNSNIPDGTFFAIGWSISMNPAEGQRQFFASIAHIPGVMATVNMRSQKSSPQVRRIIDLLIADSKGQSQLFTQLANTRFKSAGESMRQAYMLPSGTSVGVAASMPVDGPIVMDVVLWSAAENTSTPLKSSKSSPPLVSPPPSNTTKEQSVIPLKSSPSSSSSPTSPPPPALPVRRRPPLSSPPPLPDLATDLDDKPIYSMGSLLTAETSKMIAARSRAISDVSDTSLPSELPPAVPRPTLPPPPLPEEESVPAPAPMASFKMLLCIEQRHRQVNLCRLYEQVLHGICEKNSLATIAVGHDSLSTYCALPSQTSNGNNSADTLIEGSLVYGFTSAASTFSIGGYCLSIRWRADLDRKACFYSAILFRMDIEMMPEDDMDWSYLLDTMHEQDHWQETGTGVIRYYTFTDDSRQLALHANMFIEPMIVTRIELTEWTDYDIKMIDSGKHQAIYPLSAREFLINSQAAAQEGDDTLAGLIPASVNMTVQLTLENLHPTFSLQNGQLLVVDGQQVQRPPTVVPSGQSINGRFSISWAMPEYIGASIAPLACLLVYEISQPDGKELADRPHLIVGWRVNGNSLNRQENKAAEEGEATVEGEDSEKQQQQDTSRQFFARIIGDALTQDILELWTMKQAIPSDPLVVAQKDQSFIELAGNGLMPANAQSKERRLLADGRILLTHASLTSVEVASSNDPSSATSPTTSVNKMPSSVHLALKVQLSREPSRASIIGEWSLNST
ncbi:hypothetical protein BDF22DRAFT_745497 [Syncephalis plumigaleata]|nr:hypothetical protein BDF22DRAFT_745497 [Syncephalis plumigaleata]